MALLLSQPVTCTTRTSRAQGREPPLLLLPVPARSVAVSALRRQRKSQQRSEEDVEMRMSSDSLPRAPAPSDSPHASQEVEQPYPVFLPKPSAIKQAPEPWGWDPDLKAGQAPVPEWNPKTGFMRSAQQPLNLQGGSSAGEGGEVSAAQPEPQIDLLSPSSSATGEDLPQATQGQVMGSCLGTTVWMTVLALFLRAYAQANAPSVLGTDEALLAQYLQLPSGLGNWSNVGVLLGAVALVSAARFQLLQSWPDFQLATERSNKQVLSPLSWFDIGVVACLSGLSEELLFRGAIISGSFLDWRGVLLSGVIFGALHNSGGRNPAFAAWAGAVGCLYGGAFLVTKNIWVPVLAHAVANFVSAAAWKSQKRGSK